MDFRELMLEQKRLILDTSVILDTSHLGITKTQDGKIRVRNITDDQLEKWVKDLVIGEKKNIFELMKKHPTLLFEFSSLKELDLYLNVRYYLIQRMLQIEAAWDNNGNNSIANYPDGGPFGLPLAFWKFLDVPFSKLDGVFVTLPNEKNKDVSDAIKSIFEVSSDTFLDCNRMSVAVAHASLLDALGASNFKKIYEPFNRIILGEWDKDYGKLENVTLQKLGYFKKEKLYSGEFDKSSPQMCLPGDIVYFRNDSSYKLINKSILTRYFQDPQISDEDKNATIIDKRISDAWSGEFCICTGENQFAGFGLRRDDNSQFSSNEIRNTLFGHAKELYELGLEKAQNLIKLYKIAPPRLENVILAADVFRVNSKKIIEKI